MKAELPPFTIGEHNFESASTLDRDITPKVAVTSLSTFKGRMTRQIFFGWSESACLQTYLSQATMQHTAEVPLNPC